MVIPKYAFNISDTWQIASIRKGSDFFGLNASRSSVGPISDVAKNLNALPKSIARVIQQILIYVAADRPIADRFIHYEMKAASLRKHLQLTFDRTMIHIPLSFSFFRLGGCHRFLYFSSSTYSGGDAVSFSSFAYFL